MPVFLAYIAFATLLKKNFLQSKRKTMTYFKQFQRKTLILFAAFCLVVTFTAELHHHNDNCPHFDCPLCITASVLSSCSVENSVLMVFCLAVAFYLQPKETFHRNFFIFSIFLNRSPPFIVIRATNQNL